MQTQIVCQQIAKQSDCSKKRQHVFCGGHITGAPICQLKSRDSQSSPSLNRTSVASKTNPPACNNSEKREILIVGRKSSLDKQNISQKPSKPESVFCPIQPHQCRGARHNRIAGIVHLRTPTTRKNHRHSRSAEGKKANLFFSARAHSVKSSG